MEQEVLNDGYQEKLMELLSPTSLNFEQATYLADYLVKNGVTVQECKIGDKIYQTDGVLIYESTIVEITVTTKHTIFVTENIVFDERAIGETIFLSYSEAEAHSHKPPKGE